MISKATLVFIGAILIAVGVTLNTYTQNSDVIDKAWPTSLNMSNRSVYFFYSPHCPHCEEVMPYVKKIAKRSPITFCNVETMQNSTCMKVAEEADLSAVPAIAIYSGNVTLLVGSDEVRTLGELLGVE